LVSFQVVEGDPAAQILQQSDELKPDMVVMGTHSKGMLAYTFLGSVAEKVLHRIKIPVFIIPIPKEIDIAFNDI
jgi:nucleotide-binding universal stress UspA family protein